MRPLRTTILLLLLPAFAPGSLAAQDPPADTVALIEDFVIRGEKVEAAQLSELSVLHAATGAEEPGRRGLLLAAGDEVRTGPEVSAVLRFLDPAADAEPLLILDAGSAVQIAGASSVQTLLGRIFASLKGLFTVLTADGQLGVEGTELEVVVGGGGEVEVLVLAGPVEHLHAEGAGGAPRRVAPGQRLPLGQAEGAAGMTEHQVKAALDWTSDVLLATQPSYPAADDPPYFATVEERSQAFRDARYRAIWQRDEVARVELGKVYSDWGEGPRAVVAFREAGAAQPSLAGDADYRAAAARAYRQAGRLDEAEGSAREALRAKRDSGRALVALANVYREQAAAADEDGDRARAEQLLERSLAAYRRAAEAPARGQWRRRTRGVAETGEAQSRAALARIAADAGDDARAERLLGQAAAAARKARETYPEYPFATVEAGKISQARARLARRRGDEAASRAALDEAERLYNRALADHGDLAPARYCLGTVWEDRGPEYRDRALEQYRKSIEAAPTYPPSFDRLGALAEGDDTANRYRDVYRKLRERGGRAPARPSRPSRGSSSPPA